MYLLGYDIGSSSIKAALVDGATGNALAVVSYPESEMKIDAPESSWAEQDPELWWKNVCIATKMLFAKHVVDANAIQGIGISYQMHGLVLVDENQEVLRPSIIWCDSRAVEIGDEAFSAIGPEHCLSTMLNSPGNFTASKLRWVQQHEPQIYERIHKFMLPGDYIAMKLTGEITTTVSGLSEGVFWDFQKEGISTTLLDYYQIDSSLIPTILPTFSEQGTLTAKASQEIGLPKGIPVTYRAGDQPNNALSLNVFNPGEVAATGGTSGVVYGIVDKATYDQQSRVNGFAHVNHAKEDPRIGVLLCINGAGSQYNWVRQQVAQSNLSYNEMEQSASGVPIGSDGLSMLPFGNGAERILANADIGAQVHGLQFNRHESAHLYRAALEGIAFAFVYGMEILKGMGLSINHMRVGNDNLFQSSIFSNTIAHLMQTQIDVIETTGAVGAAKAAGLATGVFNSLTVALQQQNIVKQYAPKQTSDAYQKAYSRWKNLLIKQL